MRKLVSVITPTWQRPELLKRCVDIVQHQTYPNMEHILVSDGIDERIMDALPGVRPRFYVMPNELVYNWSSILHNSFGIAPLIFGMLLSSGDYQIWFSDDDEMDREHIEKLVNLLERTESDFVYSKCRLYMNGKTKSQGFDIGTDPPEHGQITNFLYTRELLTRPGCMPQFGTHPVDIALVKQWMNAGAKWAMLDEVTFYHRADQ
jgi:glycosyl transferase family 2